MAPAPGARPADRAALIAAVLAGAPAAMLAVDARARVIAGNPAATAMFGPGLTDRPFVTVLRHPAVNAALDRVLAGAVEPQRLSATVAAEGRSLVCDVTVTALPASLGGGGLVALVDTTGLARAEQMRRDFIANVSHELRTPLTALMGFIETLRGPARNDPAARDRFLAIMEAEAGRMNRMVADLLSLSRLEAEERRRPRGRVDLALVLGSVAATLGPAAEAAGVRIELDGAASGPVEVPGDRDQIVQVVQNLVENAIKYGGAGGRVRVALRHLPHEPMLRGPAWAIEVRDFGEGIDPLHLPRLTERFYRIDNHRSRAQGGTGLGLAIVKHITSRHRGRLRIDSTPGQGSTFTVILPETAEPFPAEGLS